MSIVLRSKFSLAFHALLFSALILAPALRAQETEIEGIDHPIVAPNDSGSYHDVNLLPESIRSSAPFARQYHEFARHVGTSGKYDADAYLSAFKQAQRDMLRWSQKGAGAMNAQATDWQNLSLSGGTNSSTAGITTAIVIDPKNPDIIYAGGAGGVWRSDDGGKNWTPLTDNVLPDLAIASIAIDPVNTSTLYIGTGYCYPGNINYGGTGVWRSDNRGASWTKLNFPGGTDVVKVFVHPTQTDVVFACPYNGSGIYRSADKGGKWTKVSSVSGIAWDMIATNKSNTVTLFTIFGNVGANGGIYKSVNDGVTWTKVQVPSDFPSGNTTRNTIGRAGLATPIGTPDHLYVLMTNAGAGDTVWYYTSVDGGATWHQGDTPALDLFQVPGGEHAQGWYDLYIGASTVDGEDYVYVGGIAADVYHHGSWHRYSGYPDPEGGLVGGSAKTHVDHHSIAIHPTKPEIVFVGNDGGFWSSKNGSTDPADGGWTYLSNGLITNRFYHVTIDPLVTTGSRVSWTGAQDQGNWRFEKGKTAERHSPAGDGITVVISKQSSNVLYAETVEGKVFRNTQPLGTSESWGDITTTLTDIGGWDSPLKMSPIAHGITAPSQILYLGRQNLWQTTNGGNSWNKLNIVFNVGFEQNYVTAIGLTTFDANVIYVAGGGTLKVSHDFGKTWATHNPGISGAITSIVTNYLDPKFVLISTTDTKKGVVVSMDSGLTWQVKKGATGSALPDCGVMCVAVDSASPLTRWYAATDWGMYFTTDAGGTWSFFGPALVPCRDVQIAPNKITMRVATFGRGLWEIPDVATIAPVQKGVTSTTLSVSKSAEGVQLSWFTDEEKSGTVYNVERSVNGGAFEKLESTNARGEAGRQNYSYVDVSTDGGTYMYQIRSIDLDGSEHYSNRVELHNGIEHLITYQPYPNPFFSGNRAELKIDFELPDRDEVSVNIYNTSGTLIRSLVNSKPLDGGPQSVQWDGLDVTGEIAPPGAYLYNIVTSHSGTTTGKIVVAHE
jgi:hypothetical protein